MSDWTPAKIERLKSMWGKVRTKEICLALGMNRNQILGKAHRLKLLGLGSPIKRAPGAAPVQRKPRAPRDKGQFEQRMAVNSVIARTVTPPPIVTRPLEPLLIPSRDACAWPIGDPKQPGFHFCGNTPVVEGKPYCAPCCRKAYRTPEEAARERAGQRSGSEAA
jgi:GcrA cell cycle regulator